MTSCTLFINILSYATTIYGNVIAFISSNTSIVFINSGDKLLLHMNEFHKSQPLRGKVLKA